MEAVLDSPDRVSISEGGIPLAEYVFGTSDTHADAWRPYLALWTRSGRPVTADAPDDHPWHRHLSLALPFVGSTNLWGGPTYLTSEGYRMLPNHGVQHHRTFELLELSDAKPTGSIRIHESLQWTDEHGLPIIDEQRALALRLSGDDSWIVSWHSILTNIGGAPFAIASPATRGRDGAGYGGIFWRGPSPFRGGEIIAPNGIVDENDIPEATPWLAILAADRSAGVVMADPDGAARPWFIRSAAYPGMCIAPFSREELVLEPSHSTTIETTLGIVSGFNPTHDLTPLFARLAREMAASPSDTVAR